MLWAATIGGVIALLALDFVVTRRPHDVSMREAVGWSIFYAALPLAFGAYVWAEFGSTRGVGYLTGYLVEKSLSVDNLFDFMRRTSAFAIPWQHQPRVILYVIIEPLVLPVHFLPLSTAVLTN